MSEDPLDKKLPKREDAVFLFSANIRLSDFWLLWEE